jgi:hypothetical protein
VIDRVRLGSPSRRARVAQFGSDRLADAVLPEKLGSVVDAVTMAVTAEIGRFLVILDW